MNFSDFSLSKALLKGIGDKGFTSPSPIQEEALGPILEGQDLVGQAQTGTGKTAAFGLPLLEKTSKKKQVQGLVLCPTRELSIQVARELEDLGKYKKGVRVLAVYGGAPIGKQIQALREGAQIIVGTPGRVMDHLRRGTLNFSALKMVVLDEADEMFDMGFREDMKTILDQTPKKRQTCFFSATLGQEIREFSKLYQKNPHWVKIQKKDLTVEGIDQYYLEMEAKMKTEVLSRLLDLEDPRLAMVFCNTKRQVDRLTRDLTRRGYHADGLHGDLKQTQRDNVMNKFRQGTVEVLVATDVAARGLDVGAVDMVVNYDLPQDQEAYVHRIGRTGRAGKTGQAFSFVVGRDIYHLEEIMAYTKAHIEGRDLPTLKEVEAGIQERTLRELGRVLKDNQLDQEIQSLAPLLKREDPSRVAAALLVLYGQKNQETHHQALDRVDYGKPFRSTSRRKKSGKTPHERTSGAPKLWINRGRLDGINPKVVLAALHSEAGIPKNQVGNILIKEGHTLVDLPPRLLKESVKKLNGKKIRGQRVRVDLFKGKN
ncbi:MAG: DEAD/DEAH box helicase [Tissierellia bacterium]|nr:DEAD/DEAH box helicase [Tissierellia bacterium]